MLAFLLILTRVSQAVRLRICARLCVHLVIFSASLLCHCGERAFLRVFECVSLRMRERCRAVFMIVGILE